jgi:type II secretory pathway component PulF
VGEIIGGLVVTLLIIYAVCVILFFLGKMVFRKAPTSASVDGMINRLPWISAARRNMAMSRFCKVYHACLLAGISMVETVRVSSEASQSGLVREAGGRILKVANEGTALGPQFMAEPVFPQAFSRSYMTGEEAGTLDRDMANWSNRFQEQAQSSVQSASLNVPKVMYFLMLAFVAWKIIGFFSGYYSELDAIGD